MRNISAITEEQTGVQQEQATEQQQEQPEAEQQPSAQPAVSQGDNLSRIPLDQNGEPDFEQAPAIDTWNALVEMNDGNIAEATDTASIMAQNYRDELAKVERQRPKGKTPMEIQRQKQQKAQEIARLQSLIGYWEEVASQQAQQQITEQAEFDLQIEENARTQQRAEARAENNPAPRNFARVYEGWQLPTSFREYLLRAISSRRLRFKWNDLNNRTRGLGAHLGLNQSEKERRKRLWLIDEKDGLTPEQAAEYAMTDFQSETGMPLHIDTMDALNEILDILASYDNSIDMYREVKRLYDFAQNPEAQAEEWYARQYGMSSEECALNDEAWEIFIAEREMSEEEYQNYINFVNESQVIEDEQRQTETIADGTSSTHEQQPTNTAGERSDTILPTEQSDNSAGDSIAQGQPETIDGESSVKDGSAHATQSREAQLASDAVLTALLNSGIEIEPVSNGQAQAILNSQTPGIELMAVEEAKRRADEIENLSPIPVERNSKSKAELQEDYNNLRSVDKDGRKIEFYHSAFKKIYKDGGLFGQIIPHLDEILRQSVLAYSESDNLGGTTRPDGSVHKVHDNVASFDNYVGKVSINGEDYYVRITVQQSKSGENGTHSFFVSNVNVYKNPTKNQTIPITSRGTTGLNGIVDTKLQQFFDYANGKNKNPEFQIFGGNSGYVGYSMSRRAAEAREEGRYPKTDFKKNYQITQSTLDALVGIGLIDNTEWHHTSMYGNRTTFYGWEKPWYADAYAEKKKEIDKLAKEKQLNAEAILNLFEDAKAKDVYENTLRVEQAEKEIFSAYSDAAQAHRQANLPDEYTATNGVVIVTNGSLNDSDWKGFYNGNKAWKSWTKDARNELYDKLDENSQSFPSFEQWKTENHDFVSQTYAKHNATPLEFLRTPQGTIYGWTDGKRIYLTRDGINPETPIHEYTHLWARAMMQRNPEGWQSVKDLLRDTPAWQEVINDPNYQSIANDEDAIASEALSRLSGRQGAQKMQEMANRLINEGSPNAQTLIDRMRQALQEFWNWVGTNLFGVKSFDSIGQVTDRVLWDMLNGTDLGTLNSSKVEFMGSRVEKRRAEIAEHFNGQQLSGNSQAIVNAFANGSKNEAIEVNGKHIALKQGNENKAGVSHSLMRHYGTSTGRYSADELLLIPQVIEQGIVANNGNKISYKLELDGVTYTVTTETRSGVEEFTNFFTNRKPISKSLLNTDEQHGTTSQSVSAPKISNTSSNTQESGELFRPTDGFYYNRGDKITSRNVRSALYTESGDFLAELQGEDGISLRVRRDTEIDTEKLKSELSRALPILEEFKEHTISLKSRATKSAQQIIDNQIKKIDEDIAWAKRVKENPDLFKQRERPYFFARPLDIEIPAEEYAVLLREIIRKVIIYKFTQVLCSLTQM